MKKIFIKIIRFYQRYVSPYTSVRCIYIPTCSQYGIEAIEKFGTIRGIILTIWRIIRCNPLSKGRVDPVPDKFLWKAKGCIKH